MVACGVITPLACATALCVDACILPSARARRSSNKLLLESGIKVLHSLLSKPLMDAISSTIRPCIALSIKSVFPALAASSIGFLRSLSTGFSLILSAIFFWLKIILLSGYSSLTYFNCQFKLASFINLICCYV